MGGWRTPSRSNGHSMCVKVGCGPQVIAVRDSKDPGGTVLAFTPAAWRSFTESLR